MALTGAPETACARFRLTHVPAMENLTLQERVILIGIVLLLIAGTLTRMWRHSREPQGDTPRAADAPSEFSP